MLHLFGIPYGVCNSDNRLFVISFHSIKKHIAEVALRPFKVRFYPVESFWREFSIHGFVPLEPLKAKMIHNDS